MPSSVYTQNYSRKYNKRRKALIVQSLGGVCFVCGEAEGLSICQPPFTKIGHHWGFGWREIRKEIRWWALLCWRCQEDRAPHGCMQRYWRGCRCDPCRQAMRRYHRERRARIAGRPFPRDPVLEHGTYILYSRGCRCDPCREAMRRYHRERRARVKAEKEARLRSSAG